MNTHTHTNTLTHVLNLIESGKLTEMEAERLINSVTRLEAGVPTGGKSGEGISGYNDDQSPLR